MMNAFSKMMVPGGGDPMIRLGKDSHSNKAAGPKDLDGPRQNEPFSKALERSRAAREGSQRAAESPRADAERVEDSIEKRPVKADEGEEEGHQSSPLFREDAARVQKTPETPKVSQSDVNMPQGLTLPIEPLFQKSTALSPHPAENEPTAEKGATAENKTAVAQPPKITVVETGQTSLSIARGTPVPLPVSLKEGNETQGVLAQEDFPAASLDDPASFAKALDQSEILKPEMFSEQPEQLETPELSSFSKVPDDVALEYETREAAQVLMNKAAEIETPPRMKPMGASPEILKVNESFLFTGAPDHQKGAMGGDEGGFSGNASMLFSPVFQGQEGQTRVQSVKSQFQLLLDAGVEFPDEQAILRQVDHQLRAWKPGQGEPLRFLLEPKQLGMLQIEILLQEKGVTAHMVTADPLVKALLQENQGFLQAGLKSQGLHISQFSVELGDRQGFFNQNSGQHFSRRTLPDTDATDQRHTALPVMQKPTREGGRLSLYI